jgi:polyisoprenoid-binding protein YceI
MATSQHDRPVRLPRLPRPRTEWHAGTVALLLWGVLLLGASVPTARAQGTQLTVHPKSQFWIHGEAASIDFTCQVGRVEGRAALPAARDSIPRSADQEDQTEVVVTVPVEAFDCGKRQMTRDLQDALKMENHPEIRFELIHATVGPPLDTLGHWRRVDVLGALTIAGTKRLTRLETAGRALDANRFRVRGCHPIRMTYFNIDPPTKAFGLIRVDNRVRVQFDVLAHRRSLNPDATFSALTVDDSPSCPVVPSAQQATR